MSHLTPDESLYLAAEHGITAASDRLARLGKILGRGNNLDLFTPDAERDMWRSIRSACLAETERLEDKYAFAELVATQVVMPSAQRRISEGA